MIYKPDSGDRKREVRAHWFVLLSLRERVKQTQQTSFWERRSGKPDFILKLCIYVFVRVHSSACSIKILSKGCCNKLESCDHVEEVPKQPL